MQACMLHVYRFDRVRNSEKAKLLTVLFDEHADRCVQVAEPFA